MNVHVTVNGVRIADHFWTVEQTADAWGCAKGLVWRLIRQKRIADVQFFGNQYFVPRGTDKPEGRPRGRRP